MIMQGMESVLQQMNAVASQASHQPREGHSRLNFAAHLESALDKISDVQHHARAQAEDFELGKPGVAINDVMMHVQKSSLLTQTATKVVSRVIAAYEEVKNLPI